MGNGNNDLKWIFSGNPMSQVTAEEKRRVDSLGRLTMLPEKVSSAFLSGLSKYFWSESLRISGEELISLDLWEEAQSCNNLNIASIFFYFVVQTHFIPYSPLLLLKINKLTNNRKLQQSFLHT